MIYMDLIFDHKFEFLDCNDCDFLGIWVDFEWVDSKPHWTYSNG